MKKKSILKIAIGFAVIVFILLYQIRITVMHSVKTGGYSVFLVFSDTALIDVSSFLPISEYENFIVKNRLAPSNDFVVTLTSVNIFANDSADEVNKLFRLCNQYLTTIITSSNTEYSLSVVNEYHQILSNNRRAIHEGYYFLKSKVVEIHSNETEEKRGAGQPGGDRVSPCILTLMQAIDL